MYKIKINNNYEINANSEETILDAIHNSSFSHSYSCLKGRCNSCKVKVLNGRTLIKNSEITLSSFEKDKGFVLACCRLVDSDLEITTDNFYNSPRPNEIILPVKINSILYHTTDIAELTFSFPKRLDFNFFPGQYIKIKNKNNIEKSISILSYDGTNKLISLLFKKIKNGELSNYIFNSAKLNDSLIITGPFGFSNFFSFTEKNIILIATGVGISPIKCMLNNKFTSDFFNNKKITLLWGNKSVANFIYDFKDEMSKFNIKYFKYLSTTNSNRNFEYGYVHHYISKNYKVLNDTVVYACGIEKMVSETKSICNNLGLDSKYFISDVFVES